MQYNIAYYVVFAYIYLVKADTYAFLFDTQPQQLHSTFFAQAMSNSLHREEQWEIRKTPRLRS